MTFQLHTYTVWLAVSALITLITSVIILRHDLPGSRTLAGVLAGTFVWSGAYAMTWSLTGLDEKILWLKIMYLGVSAVPTLFLIFTLIITHHEDWLSRRNLVLLGLEPLTMVLLVWFGTHLVFDNFEPGSRLTEPSAQRGAGFWINAVYSYAIILLAFVILGLSSLRANPFFRRQYLVILSASVVPFIASMVTQLSYDEPAGLDMAPVSFGVTSVLYAYAIFHHRFMDIRPVARGRLIENMSDGVLVLDEKNRIVDINPSMKNFLEGEPLELIGRDISEALKIGAQDIEQLLNGFESHTELELPQKPARHLDLRFTPLFDEDRKLSGRLIVIRDVTGPKEVEQDLRRANDRLLTQLIEIGTLQSQLREQAIRDALTGVFNRRYLEETLERELARAARELYPLCIIMMDLDYFKEVNDTYGHEAGDVVLKTLAETVTRQSRHGDFACRYGGEEFVLVMPNIGIETAKARAKELHQIIDSLNIPYSSFILTTTISMGIAWFPEHGATKEELLRAADRAMYMAKNTGRNRVIVHGEDGPAAP